MGTAVGALQGDRPAPSSLPWLYLSKHFYSFSPQYAVTEKQSRNSKIAKKGLGAGGGAHGHTAAQGPLAPSGGVTFPPGQDAGASTMSSLREVKGLPRSFCGSNTELIA